MLDLATVAPSALDETWVKHSSYHTTGTYYGYRLFDDAISVTGQWDPYRAWITNNVAYGRVNVRLPSPARVSHLVVHNGHHYGTNTQYGAKAFTFWGSNSIDSFNEATWNVDTGWTQLSTSISDIPRHADTDISDPVLVYVQNSQAWTYYAIRVSSSWGGTFVAIKKLTLLVSPETTAQRPVLPFRGRPRMR